MVTEIDALSQTQIAEFALQQFARVYDIEREVKDLKTEPRQAIRQQQTKSVLDALHQWMQLQRQKVPDGSATAKALDYNLRRWVALTRFVDNGQLPVDSNWIGTRSGPSPRNAQTGCSLAVFARASERRPSCV